MTLLLFLPLSPTLWELLVAIGVLLFGANKLPQLIKGLSQSKRDLTADEGHVDKPNASNSQKQPPLSAVDDLALFEEAQRRLRLRAQGGSVSDVPVRKEERDDGDVQVPRRTSLDL